MKAVRVRFCALVSVLCLSALLPRATLAAAPQGEAIHLDVFATQGNGLPIEGLTEQDFGIFDNGKPQPVSSFTPDKNDLEQTRVILLIDAANTDYSRLAFTRNQLDRFLSLHDGHLPFPTSLALLTEDGGVKMQNTASTDGNTLSRDLKQLSIGIRQEGRAAGFYGATDRLGISVTALADLLTRLNTMPGRKVVVWLSPGWAFLSGPNVIIGEKQQKDLFNEIMRLSDLFRASRVTLYNVDTLGTDEAGTFHAFIYKDFMKPVKRWQDASIGNISLQVLAVNSGGLVLNSSNDIAGLVDRAVRDAEPFYTLSYVPPTGEKPDEYHSVQVKVNKPGVTARTVAGYYASR
ncbi:VWA domain-containing protein [Silvibacterium acidisoli]|uniref:VWA domain-containing protein n=1 Tax=Acidobacteriaceae bacterium ZG23-2 TaxID=2883246 RepID=UPI00406C3116